MVLADYTRHRRLSYSFESTRAVPTERRIEQVKENPYIPDFRGRTTGMGGGRKLTQREQKRAQRQWNKARKAAIKAAEKLLWTGKEHNGRLLEPFCWITGIVSGTEWQNFFALRCPPPGGDPDPMYPAQYELQVIAWEQRYQYNRSKPKALELGEWHLPLVDDSERPALLMDAARISAGRCAAVSYLNHHRDESAAISIKRWDEKLAPSAHWSPGEHPAMVVMHDHPNTGNFDGFLQLRKHYAGEALHKPNSL
jgi:hypothetical protein